ncbi:MAG TPA: WD40 repeat domain-containing protein [Polyangiaceae bacterium]|nr:WD40 repeat domain-containing protein [Polyangiaceae bacterium]
MHLALLCCTFGCGAADLEALGRAQCAPHAATEVTASDYDGAHGMVALGYGDGSFELRRGAAPTLSCGAHRAGISNLVFSPDGAILATGDATGRIALSRVAERETVLLTDLASEVRGLAFNPAGTLIAASEGAEVVLIDRSGNILARANLPGEVGAVTFTGNGTELIAAGGRLSFLSVPDLRVQRTVIIRKSSWHQPAAFATDVRLSADGRTVAVLLTDGAAFLDLQSERLTIATPGWRPLGLRFARDGRVALFARDRVYVGPADPEEFATKASGVTGALADVEFQRDGTVLFVR